MSNTEAAPQPSIAEYAAALERSVREALQDDPSKFAECHSFRDLDDVADTNDFFLAADAATGKTNPFEGSSLVDAAKITAYQTFTRAAIGIVEHSLGWTA